MVMLWGLLCAALVEPAFVGWILYGTGLIAMWWMVLSLLYAPAREFWAAYEACKANRQLRQMAYERVFETELSPPQVMLTVMGDDAVAADDDGDSDEKQDEADVKQYVRLSRDHACTDYVAMHTCYQFSSRYIPISSCRTECLSVCSSLVWTCCFRSGAVPRPSGAISAAGTDTPAEVLNFVSSIQSHWASEATRDVDE